MNIKWFSKRDQLMVLALSVPLLARLYMDGQDAAMHRLALLIVIFIVAFGWNALFAKLMAKEIGAGQLEFAMLFALLLPSPVGWGGVVLATSFGWVFGREIFGGKEILPPALIAMAFAIFSFPDGGFETQWILSVRPDPLLALACLPGAALLLWKGVLRWQVVAGALLGVAVMLVLIDIPQSQQWWEHYLLGTFAIGVLFLAANPECAPRNKKARWLYGGLLGVLIISIRLFNPDQPDGVAFSILLGGLFAPLLDRALNWRGKT